MNPLRQLARVVTITGANEWKGVSSEGVTASFAQELAEVEAGTVTLAQPTVTPERAHAFIPYSYELEQDFTTLQTELSRMLVDAKDQLEASQFLTGRGHTTYYEPEGLLVGGGTAVVVQTGGTAIAVDDLYDVQEALPPRFVPRAQWLGSNTVRNVTKRLVASADASEAQIWSADERLLLGKTFAEVSEMTTSVASAEKVLVYGDVAAAFTIVDRIGMTLDVVPLYGENRRPIGGKGLHCIWRTSSAVVVPNAIRILAVKT